MRRWGDGFGRPSVDIPGAQALWRQANTIAEPYTEKPDPLPSVETPAPSWTAQPKEGLRDSSEPLILFLSPDVCKTPMGSATPAIPYPNYANPSEDAGTTPTVFFTGQKAFVLRSNTTCVHGDEPGTALGVKSGTVGGIAEPLDHSESVRAEGSPVIRNGDRFYMNDGNNIGGVIFVKDMATYGGSTVILPPIIVTPEDDPPLAPETPEEESWFATQWEALKDAVGDVADAIEDFDQTHGQVITRSLGAGQAAGGVLEAAGGVVLAGGGALLSSTGVGAVPGLPTVLGGTALAVNGVDNAITGLKTALTGEFQHNLVSEAAGGVAGLLGASPQTVESIKTSTDVASGLAGMGLGAVAATTRKAASSAVAAGDDLAVVAARRADEAAESADGIARPAKTTVGKTINQGGNNVRITESGRPPPGVRATKGGTWSVDPSFRSADEAAGVLVNGSYIKNPTARNLSESVTASGKVRVDGQIANGKYMYVVDTSGNIVIGTRGGQRMPHPTLIGGSNPQVQAAGMVDIRGGKIYSVDNASGHFKPGNGSLQSAESAFSGLPSNSFHNDFQGYVPFDGRRN